MSFNLLDIQNPEFLKKLSLKELQQLSKDIRAYIIDIVSKNGGHLSSNLGVVELTIALHRHFNAPSDKIFFDVGHQCYTHKILTGRAKEFATLRKFNGISGFQKRDESLYDCFEGGHSSTSLSTAVGMAIARDLAQEKYQIVPVIGDGALMSGMSFEALNHLGSIDNKVIIILNDNEMSISKNIGAFSQVLSKARTDWKYIKAKRGVKSFLLKIPLIGKPLLSFIYFIQRGIKRLFVKENIFDNFNLGYIGPIDGHDFKKIEKALKNATSYPRSIIVHIKTKKGKGYLYSEEDESGDWHGVAPFYKSNGAAKVDGGSSWSKTFADLLYEKMLTNEKIVVITPAMIIGSELEAIFKDFPNRAIDVGIAEEHAVTLASGLALSGYHPVIFIYSSFLQRGYDQIIHDIVRLKLPVIFAIDRCGLVGADGETHHGIFDASFLNDFPNAKVAMAKNQAELNGVLELALTDTSPFFIRFPRGQTEIMEKSEIQDYRNWEFISNRKEARGYLISIGPVINKLQPLADKYQLNLINARFIKPLDTNMLQMLDKELPIFIYDIYGMESGLANNIRNYFSNTGAKVFGLSLPEKFITAGEINELLKHEHIAISDLERLISEVLDEKKS